MQPCSQVFSVIAEEGKGVLGTWMNSTVCLKRASPEGTGTELFSERTLMEQTFGDKNAV